MWFGEIAVTECGEGCVLAHSHRVNEGRIAKGTRLTQAHLDQLTHAGVHRIWVARLDGQDVDEDEAADRLARAAAGPGLSLSRALTGRCNLHADVRGLVEVDPVRLQALNRSDWRLTLATVARHALVEPGDPVATVKVIPFAVDEATVDPDDPAMHELLDWIRVHREVELLRIEGHADGLGSSRYNYELSQRRAEAVRTWLMEGGIDGARLQAVGTGEALSTSDEKAAERRVSFLVLVWSDERLGARR